MTNLLCHIPLIGTICEYSGAAAITFAILTVILVILIIFYKRNSAWMWVGVIASVILTVLTTYVWNEKRKLDELVEPYQQQAEMATEAVAEVVAAPMLPPQFSMTAPVVPVAPPVMPQQFMSYPQEDPYASGLGGFRESPYEPQPVQQSYEPMPQPVQQPPVQQSYEPIPQQPPMQQPIPPQQTPMPPMQQQSYEPQPQQLPIQFKGGITDEGLFEL